MPINNFREDEELVQSLNITIIKRLMSYLGPYMGPVIKTLLLMAVVIMVELSNPYLMKLGIDKYIAEGDWENLFLLGGIMILINVVAVVCSRLRMLIMGRVSNSILLTIRQQLYSHIQKLSFSFFDSRPAGKILARIIGDVNSLNDVFANSVTSLIPELVKIAAVVVIMMVMNYRLGLVALATLPFMLVTFFFISTVSRKRWQLHRKKSSNLNAFTHEDFSGIRVVQSLAAEQETSGVFLELCNEWKDSFVRAVRINDFFWPTVEMSWGVGTILVFWFGASMIGTGTITPGLLVAFSSYVSMFWQPIMNISNFYNQLVTNMAGAERIFEILDIEPDIKDRPDAKPLPEIKGDVSFRNVTFGYDEGQTVLNNVSFDVSAGQTIALVGSTGAGKSTVANLISRFYEITSGEVLIDGYNVNNVTLESLRSQIGVMPQDTFLFSGTIMENIRYGKLDATDEEVVEAAKAVSAHEFIMKFEKGYYTDVNERGTRLSAGQRQLIAFARALLANPRILILDEATASIDTHTERLVQQGIRRLLEGRTSFVIAHRLSTIRNADRIMVVEEGGIVESGTHEELIRLKGQYYNLYTSQFRFLNDEEEAG
ncbi:MAG TPA: ABC transporter ATP-binding protein [Clostridiales bacterium]|nr:ABC transporter ATP-binding protein [Clostridiales bacterium]HPZ05448.1 ABC transporter ATP-binding protein [Clostridiales bacterium]HQD31222.1 ABC transporter ATP-binding protein [Clostridiales bacterium]